MSADDRMFLICAAILEAGAVPARAAEPSARFLDVSSHTLAPLPERSGGGVFSGGRAAGVRGAVAGPEGARA